MEYDFYLSNHQGVPRTVLPGTIFPWTWTPYQTRSNEKTRAVLINYPNNPTGAVYRDEELKELASVLTYHSEKLGRPVYLISDEPYRKIVYDGADITSVFDVYRESFVVTSFSKDLSLPGERIGYIAAHPEMSDSRLVVSGLVLCNRILGFVNAPALMQRAVARLLYESVDISLYLHKRDMLCEGLESCGLRIRETQGGVLTFSPRPPSKTTWRS